jgi:hypothetical protein
MEGHPPVVVHIQHLSAGQVVQVVGQGLQLIMSYIQIRGNAYKNFVLQ